MRRTAVLIGLAFGSIALLPAGATAGGADWFEFRRPYYAPGDTGVARTRVWFASEERAHGVTHARVVAYLLPENRWLEPPGVPKAAIPLGPVTFSAPEDNTALATLEFTVPQVPSGDWNVSVCNVPCTDEMIGYLYGGSMRIATSPEMATIMRLRDRLEAGLRQAERGSRRSARGFREEVGSLRLETRVLSRQVGELEAKLAKLTARSRRPPAPAFPAPIGWILVALTILFGLVAFRPRRAHLLSPDPPEIERIDEAEHEAVG
jgi:hypothetical protein